MKWWPWWEFFTCWLIRIPSKSLSMLSSTVSRRGDKCTWKVNISVNHSRILQLKRKNSNCMSQAPFLLYLNLWNLGDKIAIQYLKPTQQIGKAKDVQLLCLWFVVLAFWNIKWSAWSPKRAELVEQRHLCSVPAITVPNIFTLQSRVVISLNHFWINLGMSSNFSIWIQSLAEQNLQFFFFPSHERTEQAFDTISGNHSLWHSLLVEKSVWDTKWK